jgi:hypothetical protein
MKEQDNEYLNRFCAICNEVNVDAELVMDSAPAMVGAIVRRWMIGEIDDTQVMRSVRNLAILNPKILKGQS